MSEMNIDRSRRDTRYVTVISIAIACLVIFSSNAIFRIRDYTEKTVDFQVIFKMSCIALSLVVPLVALISRRLSLSNPILIAWLITLLSLVLSAAQANNPGLSLSNSVPMLGAFLFCVWMTQRFGENLVVMLLVFLVSFMAICSLVVYFAYPELGRMHAWLGSEFGENSRIQGIAGTPNGLGSMTSMALVLTLLYFKSMDRRVRIYMLCAAVPSAVCLIMTNSRMSIASLIVCGAIYFLRKGNKAANITIAVLALAFLVVVFFSAPDMFLSSLARSGDAAEITTGTGRSEIWGVVLEHIAARPLTGYGYAMATTILPLDPRLFSAAAHCHNMYLEVLFSGGAISFSLLIIAMFSTLYAGMRTNCFEPMVVLLFYLLRGLTEPAPFYNLPSFAAYAFFLAITFIVKRARLADQDRDEKLKLRASDSLARCRANLASCKPV